MDNFRHDTPHSENNNSDSSIDSILAGAAAIPVILAALASVKDSELQGPNLRMPVMDMGVCWDILEDFHGLRLERNTFTHHYRIVSPDKLRLGWGTEKAMRKDFAMLKQKIIDYAEKKKSDG